MSTTMRAKVRVAGVTKGQDCEQVRFIAVCRSDGYPADGAATLSPRQQIARLQARITEQQARITELEALLDGCTRTVNVDASARLADCIGDLGELALDCSAGHTIVLPDNLAPGDYISVTLSKARADEGEQP